MGGVYFLIGVLKDGDISKSFAENLFDKIRYWLASSPGGGLWYVQAVLILVLFLCIMGRNAFENRIVTVTFFFIMLGIGCDAAYNIAETSQFYTRIVSLYEDIFISRLNFAFYAEYFLCGIILNRYVKRMPDKRTLIVSVLILYIAYLVTGERGGNWFFLFAFIKTILAVVLFFMLLNIESKFCDITILKIRKLSGIVYFTHFASIYAVKIIYSFMGIDYGSHCTIAWGICCVMLTIYGLLIIKLGNRSKFFTAIY